jgi:uncharacterized protein involved in tolerance to divalent cations
MKDYIAIGISLVALVISGYTASQQLEKDGQAIEASVLSSQIDACVKLSTHHYTQGNHDAAVEAINAARSLTDCLATEDLAACRTHINEARAGHMCIGG